MVEIIAIARYFDIGFYENVSLDIRFKNLNRNKFLTIYFKVSVQ